MELSPSENGQILLITLLVLSVATTIALSLIGRSTTDVAISTQVDESNRAFSAAEAGIEQALKLGFAPTPPPINTFAGGASFEITSDIITGVSDVYSPGRITKQGETAIIWLVDHNSDGSLPFNDPLRSYPFSMKPVTLCWSGLTGSAAVSVSELYWTGSAYATRRRAYDGDAVRAASDNNFIAAAAGNPCNISGPNINSASLTFDSLSVPPSLGSNPVMIRIKPLYSDINLALKMNGVTLPPQGKQYESCGSTEPGSTTAKITRCVQVEQQYRSALSIFDYVLYSEDNGSNLEIN